MDSLRREAGRNQFCLLEKINKTTFEIGRWGVYMVGGLSQIYGVSEQPPTKASSSGMHTEAYYPTWDRSERQSSADGLKGDDDGYWWKQNRTNSTLKIRFLLTGHIVGKMIGSITGQKRKITNNLAPPASAGGGGGGWGVWQDLRTTNITWSMITLSV